MFQVPPGPPGPPWVYQLGAPLLITSSCVNSFTFSSSCERLCCNLGLLRVLHRLLGWFQGRPRGGALDRRLWGGAGAVQGYLIPAPTAPTAAPSPADAYRPGPCFQRGTGGGEAQSTACAGPAFRIKAPEGEVVFDGLIMSP